MVEPLTIVTQVANIGNVIYQTVKLIEALKAAPDEFNTTVRHVRSLSIVLESVRSDLVDNPRSIINAPNNLRQSKCAKLARLVSNCDKSLQKVEAVLKKYKGSQRSVWIAWRWSSKGKQEVDTIHADLVFWIHLLNLFLANETRESLWKTEIAVEEIRRALERLSADNHLGNSGGHRNDGNRRKLSSIGGAIFASLFISRLKARLRRNKKTRRGKGVQRPNLPKPIVRVRTQPLENKRRTTLLAEYAGALVEENINNASNSGRERFECWLVIQAQYSFGSPAIYTGRQIKRGQMQLKEMAKLFEAAGQGSTCGVDRNHGAVKWMLRQRNRNKSRYGWALAAARVEFVESSPHGMIRYKKVLVILRRLPR